MNNLAQSNIIMLRNDSIKNLFDLFINKCGHKSKNTAKTYSINLREFFNTMGKSVEILTWDDVLDIGYQDMLNYQEFLMGLNKNNTVNNKMAAIKSFWRFLRRNNKDIDVNITDVDKLPENVESYGSLTVDEVYRLYDYCLGLKYRAKHQKMFFELSFVTSIRKDALLRIKWNDNVVQREDKNTSKKVWCICVKDKGNKDIVKPISDELYERLRELYVDRDYSDRVFYVSDQVLRKTLSEFCKVNSINRNITLHSMKSSGMDYVHSMTGDIMLTAKQGNHTGIEMAYRNYCGKNSGLMDQTSYWVFDKKVSIDDLSELSKEDLLRLINKAGNDVIVKLVGLI